MLKSLCFDLLWRHLRICVLAFFQGQWRSLITGSFVQITKPPQQKREWRRRIKGLWIGDRWGGFLWLQRRWEPFQLSFGPLFCSLGGWGEARDLPQSSLEAYPCCCKQKHPNNATFSQSGATCQWLFFPHFQLFPLFPSFLAFIFIGRLVLYPEPSGPHQRGWDSFPFSFCEEVRAGNIYG